MTTAEKTTYQINAGTINNDFFYLVWEFKKNNDRKMSKIIREIKIMMMNWIQTLPAVDCAIHFDSL